MINGELNNRPGVVTKNTFVKKTFLLYQNLQSVLKWKIFKPVCKVTIDTPLGTGSKAGSVLSSRRGQILGLGPHPDWARWERIEAMLPEAGLHGLDAELRSLSQGLASYTAAFDHLAELGGKQADEVVKARAGEGGV